MHILVDATMNSMQKVARLIEQFIPDNYNLSLSFDRPNRTFGGIVTVHGMSQLNSNSIILHSKDLVIKAVVFDGKKAEFSHGDNDTLVINHPDIHDGKHILVITFNGKITDAMHGLYTCYYEHGGVKKELLATQFESHHTREVFPCIDEPEAKATFDVTLDTELNVTVLGNMPIKKQMVENSRLITIFDPTPLMSSYLLAWVIGELHKKTAHTKSGVEVNVWATPAQSSNSLDFALDIATRTIDFFNEYFDTPYPLPKCDHVALPDFSSGAMENWGLITYREIALLVDPATTSVSTRHYIATIITHELSHQWFGNLVTMKWWNDLWLNESFASLVEYTAVDALEPSWNVWLDFASSESIAALQRDSLAGVQSVQTDVNHPDEISTLFDGAIVYAKGARLLQMLQNYIGDQAFQTGIKNYFKNYAYKNTEAVDLWNNLSESSNKNIAAFMTKWITQPGFPVLHVCEKDSQILLHQERLTNNPNKEPTAIWPIPLNSNCPDMPEIFDTKSITVNCGEIKSPLRFNIGNNAHFVTHYSPELLGKLIDQLKAGELSTIDRLQLLHEQTILAAAGIITSSELIPLLDAFRDEKAEAVWDIISMAIGSLKKFVENDNNAELKLRSFAGSLAQRQYEKLGLVARPNEPETDTKLRSTIVGIMLYYESPDIISSVIDMFNSAPIEQLNPELRSLILSATVRSSSNDDLINSLIKKYKTTNSAELQQDICLGLTATRDSKTAISLLDMLKDTSVIRNQDVFRWIIYLMRNKYSRDQTWQWVRDNWSWINATFGGDKSYDDYPRYVATALSTQKQFNEYKDFFIPLSSDPALTRVINMGINEIRNRVDLIDRDGSSVRKTLLSL